MNMLLATEVIGLLAPSRAKGGLPGGVASVKAQKAFDKQVFEFAKIDTTTATSCLHHIKTAGTWARVCRWAGF